MFGGTIRLVVSMFLKGKIFWKVNMETKQKNFDQLNGNTTMDSDISCEYGDAKGKNENMIQEEDDDDNQL